MFTRWIPMVAGLLSTFSLMSGCATADSDTDAVPIVGLVSDADSLVLTAVSTGCSLPGDFSFDVERRDPALPAMVTVLRDRPDLCRKIPHAVTFRYPLEEVGISAGESIAVSNPLVTVKRIERE